MKFTAQTIFDDRTETTEGHLPEHRLFIVYKRWPTGKIERVIAFFSEASARAEAALLVGQDAALIGLEMIDVADSPKPQGAV